MKKRSLDKILPETSLIFKNIFSPDTEKHGAVPETKQLTSK